MFCHIHVWFLLSPEPCKITLLKPYHLAKLFVCYVFILTYKFFFFPGMLEVFFLIKLLRHGRAVFRIVQILVHSMETKCGNFVLLCSRQGITALIYCMFLFHSPKSMCCAWRCVTVYLLHDVLWEISHISVTVIMHDLIVWCHSTCIQRACRDLLTSAWYWYACNWCSFQINQSHLRSPFLFLMSPLTWTRQNSTLHNMQVIRVIVQNHSIEPWLTSQILIFYHSWWMKDQLDVTCYFISLIMRSTCFGH